MRRLFRTSLILLAALSPACLHAATFDRAAWAADFDQLKSAITSESPNLEWAVRRGLDLPATEKRARDRLAAANDDAAARFALDRFVRAFGDGHMELNWPAGRASAPAAPAARASTCAALGYRSEPDISAIAGRMPGYRSLSPEGAQIAAGLLQVDGRRVGVLRIPLFAPDGGTCARVLAERGISPDAPCDEACADAFGRRADALFLAEIETRLRTLAAARADVLLVDVAGNGGGNDTAIAIARMLGGVDAPSPKMAFVKSAARARDFEEDERDLRRALATAAPKDRLRLQGYLATLSEAQAQAARRCDLSPLWRGRAVGCSQLISGPFYAGGFEPLDLPTESAREPWAEKVSSTARFRYTPGLWKKPLILLVDTNSASSTELMGAMLQDAGRAIVVGSPSFGAGCGWTLPHAEIVLRHSGGRLSLPDCARFRRDGCNEIDGLQPDVLVGFRTFDSPAQRAGRLGSRLADAVEKALRSKRRSN